MDQTVTAEQAAELLDISPYLVVQLIQGGVIRPIGIKTDNIGRQAWEIPSQEVSRILREGFVPFTQQAYPNSIDLTESEVQPLIETATKMQRARRRLKTLHQA
jgi:hypothetical protein